MPSARCSWGLSAGLANFGLLGTSPPPPPSLQISAGGLILSESTGEAQRGGTD